MTTIPRVYTVAVYQADEGGFWCDVLDLPGCVAQGETLDELRANALEAIGAWEETVQEMGGAGSPHQKLYSTWTLPVENEIGSDPIAAAG